MNDLFLTILSLSFAGGMVALLLRLLQPLLRSKTSRTWQYYIYLAVILRLLIPLNPEHSLLAVASNHLQARPGQEMAADYGETEPLPPPVFPQAVSLEDGRADEGGRPDPGLASAPSIFRLLVPWLWTLWLIPAVVLFGRKWIGYFRFISASKLACVPVESEGILQLYREVCDTLGIRRPPALVVGGKLSAPALLGAVEPVIALPDTGLDRQQLRHILSHELTHYRRLDIVYKWLVQAALCLHWYNPAVHWISREIDRCCELSCDEAVIKRLDESGKRAYGDMLLDAIQPGGSPTNKAVSLALSEDTKLMKERLTAIMGYKKSSRLTRGISALLAVAIVTGAAFTGVYAAGSSTAPEKGSQAGFSGDRESIVKTFSGDGIETINIYAELCTLVLERSATGSFEVHFSYPKIVKSNYDKYFELSAKRQNDSTAVISTQYENQHGFDPIPDSGFDDAAYPDVAILTVKIPEKRYSTVNLSLSVPGSRPLAVGVNAAKLNIRNNVGNLTIKTDRVYEQLSVQHYVGNIELQVPALGKQLDISSSTGVFTLSLLSDPTDVSLNMRHKDDTASYQLPATWNPAATGQGVRYQRGSGLHSIFVDNEQYSVFAVEIAGLTNGASPSGSPVDQVKPSGHTGQSGSPVYKHFSDTEAAKRYSKQTGGRGNYLTTMRIDVQNSKGDDCQAIIFICEGADTYRKDFLDALKRLKAAYPGEYGGIMGYMDLIRDNRLRNFGDSDYFAVEEVTLTDTQGVSCTGYIIAACGTEQFEQPFKEFWDFLDEQYWLSDF